MESVIVAYPVSRIRHRIVASLLAVLLLVVAFGATGESAWAGSVTGKTAVNTQLMSQPRISGLVPILWVPKGTTLTLQCLATGEKAWGALAAADPYYYMVSYSGKSGYISDSDVYTAKDATKLGLPSCTVTLPAEPGSPATGSVTQSSVVLSWRDASNNETAFKTQYSTDGGATWTAGPAAGADATSVTISGLGASRKYTFQVGASNSAGTKWSAYTTATTLAPPTLPTQPASPSVSSVTPSSVVLSWRDASNNETGFKTQYSTNGGASWTAGPSAAANSTSVTITGLGASQKYTFQVGASNSVGTKWSAYATATTSATPVVKNVASGLCDYVKSGGNYVKSSGKGAVLGTYTLNGWVISVCGPRPNFGGGSVGAAGRGVNPFGGSPNATDLDGYQCTELAARWLYYVYGAKLASSSGSYAGGNGVRVVDNYAAKFSDFVKYSNAKTNPPAPGDVISFNTGTAAGHVGIVYSVNITSTGGGSIQVLEQNSGRPGADDGMSTYSVSNWKIEQAVNWLHKK